jgi:EAL domain-containing protein (putative c-di-GMP-specific phosphodiesterase class I)
VIRVVIVDDHQMVLESLRRLLAEQDSGIEVVGAEMSAQAGIDRVHLERPDVVIMDLVLPDMDGATAAGRLIADFPDMKIIILTGNETPGGHADAMAAGCSAWVRKTRAVHDLAAAIRDVHDGSHTSADLDTGLPGLSDLVVHYQPILNLDSMTIVGFEALVRWQHPERGLLRPALFLPLAEETGFIADIGTVVANQALTDLRTFKRISKNLYMSVNLSAPGLHRVGIVDAVAEIVDATDTNPRDLILEINEAALVEDAPMVTSNIHAFKALGVRLALDDFGTAFSSLSRIRRFPFDQLKIDQSFVAELPYAPRSVLLMEAVHQYTQSLGMDAIAEGIERLNQLECLRAAGWKLGQGFLFSRPVPATNAAELLK